MKLSLALLSIAMLAVSPASTPTEAAAAGDESAREVLRLRIVNDAGGEIAASSDGGDTWEELGRVVRYTTRINPRAYTASKWIGAGRVAATAVNAIHISVGVNEAEDRGMIFSMLPREFLAPPGSYQSFLSPGSSIYTDIGAGEAIFGGGAAPLVGNPVYRRTPSGTLEQFPWGEAPARGDEIVIVVLRPDPYPIAVEFDNREGGEIVLRFPDGSRRLLGYVIRPVRGVGRFEGGLYAGIGRVRANHAGVIDVSLSPVGFLGGFQIIPAGHALSPEMDIAWERTQWMIVGPVAEESPLWEGLAALFYQHLRPDYLPEDLLADDWRNSLLARFLVDADRGLGWSPAPCLRLASDPAIPLPEWAEQALASVERIRILFPLAARSFGPGSSTAARSGPR